MLPNEASHHPHVGKEMGGFETISILLSTSISDGSDDTNEKRQTLCVDAEEQESPVRVGEGVVGPSCLGVCSGKQPPSLETHGANPEMCTEIRKNKYFRKCCKMLTSD